jgi:uncharacterized protein (TIGR03086 family)
VYTPNGLKVLSDAHGYLRTAVLGVSGGSWGGRTPCTEWTVRQVLNHARLDQLAYAGAVTGEPGMPPSDPFRPVDGFGGAPLDELDEALAASASAWATVSFDAPNAPTPIGALPPWVGAGACALDAAVHGWDIAVATGQDLPLPEELAEQLALTAAQIVDFIRDSYHVYAPALDGPANAGHADTLLRFLGRDPGWRAAEAG